jgi:O-antigen/teichoic acid export membrane protein
VASDPALDAEPTESEARRAVRNASLLAGQRGLDVLRAVAFVSLVPRLLGVADFGRFALLASVSQWFALLSGLGSTQLMGRFVPVMLLREDGEGLRRLLGGLIALRALTGAGAAATLLLLAHLWLPDLSLTLVLPIAAGVWIRSVANVPFAFFLGLNEAARWGAGEMVRRWASLATVTAGALTMGLRGACLGVLAAEVAVATLGLLWARPHLALAHLRLDRAFLAPHLRYNVLFFASNLLFALTQRTGEVIARVAGLAYTEVGYVGVAMSVFAVLTQTAWRLLMAFLPLLSRQRAQGEPAAMTAWVGRLLLGTVALGTAVCIAAVLLASDVVPWLLGAPFGPSAALLPLVAVAALLQAAGGVGRVVTLALDRPRLALAAALAQAVVWLGLGVPLAQRLGARGVTVALVAATLVHAVVFLGGVWRMRGDAHGRRQSP